MLWRFRIYVVAIGFLAGSLLFGFVVGIALPKIHYASGVATIGFYLTALALVHFAVPAAWVDRYVRRPVRRARRR